MNEVVLQDCIEGMRAMPSNSVDLVVADPPYNLNKDFGPWKERERRAEWLPWTKTWLGECERVLKPGGSIFVYGIHHHICWVQCHMHDLGLTYRRQIIWHYENGFAGYTKSLAANYEPLLWFSKGDSYTYHVIREPYKSTERLKHRITKKRQRMETPPRGQDGRRCLELPNASGTAIPR
jgi:site-specific DNA-methyltransferase (adenine-specific)